MKIVIIFFCIFAYAIANPLPNEQAINQTISRQNSEQRGIVDSISSIAGSVWSSLSSSLSLASNVLGKVAFLTGLKNSIMSKVALAGKITKDVGGVLVQVTMEFVVRNNLMTDEEADHVVYTISGEKGFLINGNAKLLEQDHVDGLIINGDPAAAANFRCKIRNLIQAKKNGGVAGSTLRLLAGLEIAALDLLVANDIINFLGARETKDYFELPAVAKGV